MPLTRAVSDGIATLTLDDGKVNAFDLDVFAELDARLDECAEDAAVVLAGRDGMLSAGLNVKVLAAADDAGLTELLLAFGRTMLRIWLEPRPVVVAATGHAVAGGTILAMAADHVVAAAGDYRWGLTETTIGFPLPGWVIAMARANVRTDRLERLLLPGATVDAAGAVEAGFADELAVPEAVVATAQARAAALAALPRGAYAATKRRLRGSAADAASQAMLEDLRSLLADRVRP